MDPHQVPESYWDVIIGIVAHGLSMCTDQIFHPLTSLLIAQPMLLLTSLSPGTIQEKQDSIHTVIYKDHRLIQWLYNFVPPLSSFILGIFCGCVLVGYCVDRDSTHRGGKNNSGFQPLVLSQEPPSFIGEHLRNIVDSIALFQCVWILCSKEAFNGQMKIDGTFQTTENDRW